MNNILEHLVLQQEEKEALLSRKYVTRGLIEEKLLANLHSDIIKVITGPRRSGKSTLAINILNSDKKSKNFIYINFDSRELLDIDLDTKTLIACLKTFKTKYIFLDEIQNLKNFELLVSTLQRNGFKQVISGSNSHMLSGELATHLTGRYLKFELYPFSISEVSKYPVEKANFSGLYPEIVVNQVDPKLYLKELFNSIILKDIVERYKLRKISDLSAISEYIINNIGTRQSFKSISEKLKIPSLSSVSKYLGYLSNVYLLIGIRKFSFKSSEIIKNPSKYYCVDNGLVQTMSSNQTGNLGRLLENQVLLEIIKSGIDPERIYYFISKKLAKEIDFLTKLNSNEYIAIQVCLTLEDDRIKEREIAAFDDIVLEFSDNVVVRKIIVTKNKENYLTKSEAGSIEVLDLVSFAGWIRNYSKGNKLGYKLVGKEGQSA